MHILVQVG